MKPYLTLEPYESTDSPIPTVIPLNVDVTFIGRESCKLKSVEAFEKYLTTAVVVVDSVQSPRTVSRFHCSITFLDGIAVLRDSSSTNGTMVNGLRTMEAQLKHGDIITIGCCENIAINAGFKLPNTHLEHDINYLYHALEIRSPMSVAGIACSGCAPDAKARFP